MVATVQAKLDQINGSTPTPQTTSAAFCVSATYNQVQEDAVPCYETGKPRCCKIPEESMQQSWNYSNETVYSNEILECFSLNLHRIDKDVKRCDRSYAYFTEKNLDKLRNIMCT